MKRCAGCPKSFFLTGEETTVEERTLCDGCLEESHLPKRGYWKSFNAVVEGMLNSEEVAL